jgi:OmpA-OmpF porin, OOP family
MNNSTRLLCVGLLAGIGFAQAQTTSSNSARNEGAYVGISGGASRFKLKKEDFSIASATTRTFDEKDKGFKVFGGYRFNEHLAVEGQVASLGEASVEYGAATGGSPVTEKYKLIAASASVVGLMPVGSDFTLFAKAGPSAARAESSFDKASAGTLSRKTRVGAMLGVGATYAFTDHLALRGEFEQVVRVGQKVLPGRSTAGLLSVGLQYKF